MSCCYFRTITIVYFQYIFLKKIVMLYSPLTVLTCILLLTLIDTYRFGPLKLALRMN